VNVCASACSGINGKTLQVFGIVPQELHSLFMSVRNASNDSLGRVGFNKSRTFYEKQCIAFFFFFPVMCKQGIIPDDVASIAPSQIAVKSNRIARHVNVIQMNGNIRDKS